MRKTKNTARLLAVVMTVSLLPQCIFATPQNGVKRIIDIVVGHTHNSNNDTIIPKVNITWERPADNLDGELINSYILTAKNYNKPAEVIRHQIVAGTEPQISYEMGEIMSGMPLKSGVLYEMAIQAQHTHKSINGVDTTDTSPITPQSTAYFITNLDTRLEGKKDRLELSWEYIPYIEYEITYVQGDYGKIEEFPKDGVTKYTLRSDQITPDQIVTDQSTGRDRVTYIIETNITPGQVYSAYVTPKVPPKHALSAAKTYIGKSPKVAVAVTEIGLDVFNIGNETIRLEWNVEPSIMSGKYKLVESQIWAQPIDGQPNLVYTFKGDNGKLGYYEMYEPKKETYFWIEFAFQSGIESNAEILEPKPITNKVLYTPYEMMEKPLSPRIPKPASKEIEFTSSNIKEYLVTGDDISYNASNIIDHTFHVSSLNPLQVQLIWDAPRRKDQQIDYNLTYDIWVTNSKEFLEQNDLKPLLEDIDILDRDTERHISNQRGEVVGLTWILDSYYDQQQNVKKLIPNQTYYIKIVAKRGAGNKTMKSDPTIVAITLGKDGDIFAPPVLGKPPLQLKEEGITSDTATIKWLEKWYEIIAKNPDATMYPDKEELYLAQMWNAKVFTGASQPAIHFKQSQTQKLTEHILKKKEDVQQVQSIVEEKTGDKSHFDTYYTSRQVSLGKDVKYELKLVPYEEIRKQLNGKDISIWIQENESKSTEGWQTIQPTVETDSDQLIWQEYQITGLKANTSYVAMIRAYRELADGTVLPQTYPSYLLFTTLTDHESPEPTPKVPILNLEDKSDTSITVGWEYNKQFEYEIVYSRTENPGEAKVWEINLSDDPESPNYVANGSKAIVTINGLFPETTYNVWIRAKQKKGDKVSAWSNPVTTKTKSIEAPEVPTGVGLAAYQSIIELGLDFKPAGSDYVTVEWNVNQNDKGTQIEGNIEKRYEYEVEVADNVEFLDAKSITISDRSIGTKEEQYEILAKNIVKFTGLIANRPYYVKVKTRIVLKDVEGKKEICKESKQTKWIRVLTKASDEEYDGGNNENIVIFPDNIEEEYKNDIWTIEIVNPQGIITEILNKKDYYFTIDATLYEKKYDAEIRRVRVPKSVLTALAGQNMELRVLTNLGKYEIKPQTLNYYIQKAQAKDIVEFTFKTVFAYDIRNIMKPYPYVMLKAEEMKIHTKTQAVPMSKLDGYMKVGSKLPYAYDLLYRGIESYIYTTDTESWIKQPKNIEQFNEDYYMSYTTPLVGTYATYKVDQYTVQTPSLEMQSIKSQYGVEELGNRYTGYDQVHSDEYIRLLLGIAKNTTHIKLGETISQEFKKQAKVSGIYIEDSEGYLTEEQAINGIVRLYEMKTGYKVKPSAMKFTGVSNKYATNISKAYALGIIRDITPKKQVNYRELCEWINKAGF